MLVRNIQIRRPVLISNSGTCASVSPESYKKEKLTSRRSKLQPAKKCCPREEIMPSKRKRRSFLRVSAYLLGLCNKSLRPKKLHLRYR
jgi:hypothetical protein